MEEKFEIEVVEFDETLFEKNVGENDFSGCDTDGFGTVLDENIEVGVDNDAIN